MTIRLNTNLQQHIHVDFAEPFLNNTFFVVIDAHSKWSEVIELHSTTTQTTIMVLGRLFSMYGIPQQLVSDNTPQFTSTEFQDFIKGNGIEHIHSAPYHPSTNGQAARFIRTFKRSVKAGQHSGLSVKHRVWNVLLTYRCTPNATTGQAPGELFLKRTLITRLDLLCPNV